jgi:hypothetical protein
MQIPEMLVRLAAAGLVGAEVAFRFESWGDLIVSVRGRVGEIRVGGDVMIISYDLKAARIDTIALRLRALEEQILVEIERVVG